MATQSPFAAFLGSAVPYAGFAAQLGLGLLTQDAANTEARRKRDAAMRQQNIAYHQKRRGAEQYNQRQAQLKIIRDRVADQQIGFNAEAAANANAAEQARYAESILKSGFATAANQRQLIKLMGANAAANEGNRGRSFERASMLETLGNYGRMQAERTEQLIAERGQYERNLTKIQQQWKGANLQALAQKMIPAGRMDMPIKPSSIPFENPNTNALQIGNLALGALGTGFSLTATGDKFFGIPKNS
ncbi:MAG: hypothetical protein CMM02_11780 [Rhodopirellula sp.]|jgi:hypothetical protein|nr:hypothetical protein [Rhodopirellula sp.]|tara:strand:- start:2039 stop:2776 length:738 start_codon:yes stop_codon:yes gene_type:complete